MVRPLHHRAIHMAVDADSSEPGQDGRRIGVQDDGDGVASAGFAEAVSPRPVRRTRLQERDHRVLPDGPLDDMKAFGSSLRHFTIIPEAYDNSYVATFANDASCPLRSAGESLGVTTRRR